MDRKGASDLSSSVFGLLSSWLFLVNSIQQCCKLWCWACGSCLSQCLWWGEKMPDLLHLASIPTPHRHAKCFHAVDWKCYLITLHQSLPPLSALKLDVYFLFIFLLVRQTEEKGKVSKKLQKCSRAKDP